MNVLVTMDIKVTYIEIKYNKNRYRESNKINVTIFM